MIRIGTDKKRSKQTRMDYSRLEQSSTHPEYIVVGQNRLEQTRINYVEQIGRQTADSFIDRQKDRQTDRQTDRYLDRQIDRQTNRQIPRYIYTQIHRYLDRQIPRYIYLDTQIPRYTNTQKEIDGWRDADLDGLQQLPCPSTDLISTSAKQQLDHEDLSTTRSTENSKPLKYFRSTLQGTLEMAQWHGVGAVPVLDTESVAKIISLAKVPLRSSRPTCGRHLHIDPVRVDFLAGLVYAISL